MNVVAPFPKKPNKPEGQASLVTEDNAATRFVMLHGDRLRYCHSTGAWFIWDGFIWRRDYTKLAFHWGRELSRTLAVEQPDRIQYATSKVAFASGVERFAQATPGIAVTFEHWDRDLYLLGTPMGTVDLRTGQLRKPDPDDMISKSVAVAPSDEASCPLWIRFLDETFGGDAELIRFVQQFAGYSLTGDIREHKLLFGFGGGCNGKSVLINTITGIIGDYATTAAMDTLAAQAEAKHPTELARLKGARFVTASETENGRAWAEARLKLITGGDKITARYMRQDFFEFQPEFKLFVIGNHKPVLRNVDDAVRRRVCIVPFLHQPEVPDRDLEAKLKEEWPSILRWMIDGCADWQANGLVLPRVVLDATADYLSGQDTFGEFLDEECDCEPENDHLFELGANLFEAWTRHARAAGEEPGSKKALADNLQRRGFERHKSYLGRGFRGIRLQLRRTHGTS